MPPVDKNLAISSIAVQLGSCQISQRAQLLFRHFAALRSIETTTEFLVVGMAARRLAERGSDAPGQIRPSAICSVPETIAINRSIFGIRDY
jgi:hypothetical protein